MLREGLGHRGFPAALEVEAGRAAAAAEREPGSRRDLTALSTFTVDPATARDFDDAVSAQREGDGARVWIHIADVAAHVPPGSPLDREARRRANSTYAPGAVESMLPHALSEEACSLAPRVERLAVTAEIELPDTANLSVFHRLNERWDLMADVQWTGWSTFKNLTFVRTTGALLSTTPENFDDAWRVAVGATYHWDDAWSFRGGLAWDQSPVKTVDRTPRLPDADRYWISVGAQYKFNRNLALDAGFTYIPIKDPDINQNAGSTAANGLIKGTYDASVTIFSAQITYTF